MTRSVLIGVAVLGAIAAGCTPSHTFYRPEGTTVERAGADLGTGYAVPPDSGAEGGRIVVSTDGARVVTTRSGARALVIRIRFALDNLLDRAVRLDPASTTLVDSSGIIFPVKYMTTSGVGEDGAVGARERGTVDLYFELGHPAMVRRVRFFTVSWLYSIGDKTYPGQTKFVRFKPVRLHYYYDPWPASWVWGWGVGTVVIRRRSTTSARWGP